MSGWRCGEGVLGAGLVCGLYQRAGVFGGVWGEGVCGAGGLVALGGNTGPSLLATQPGRGCWSDELGQAADVSQRCR